MYYIKRLHLGRFIIVAIINHIWQLCLCWYSSSKNKLVILNLIENIKISALKYLN